MKNVLCYKSPVGILKIEGEQNVITGLYFVKNEFESIGTPSDEMEKCKMQLDEYFSGKRKEFNLNLNPKGTAFQLKVWNALQTVPYGETQTYGYIAKAINNPKAVRAVGGANNRNPISIIIPCHRIIGTNGKLVGYGGGLEVKEYLLNLERQ
ncbi:MAG: methylated-DNA--[protein]-cysteine S-methyltransferase [Lachnospiraceae bacterium]|nr:methylated-DNA--[protein]-cysteine S-methyltransferase [Lachnospiraceae bacterium]